MNICGINFISVVEPKRKYIFANDFFADIFLVGDVGPTAFFGLIGDVNECRFREQVPHAILNHPFYLIYGPIAFRQVLALTLFFYTNVTS